MKMETVIPVENLSIKAIFHDVEQMMALSVFLRVNLNDRSFSDGKAGEIAR